MLLRGGDTTFWNALFRSVKSKTMAVSLSYGVVFASLVTLLLVPALFVIVGDVIRVASKGHHQVGEATGLV